MKSNYTGRQREGKYMYVPSTCTVEVASSKNKPFRLVKFRRSGSPLQCVIINKSDDKKTVRSRLEDSAVDY